MLPCMYPMYPQWHVPPFKAEHIQDLKELPSCKLIYIYGCGKPSFFLSLRRSFSLGFPMGFPTSSSNPLGRHRAACGLPSAAINSPWRHAQRTMEFPIHGGYPNSWMDQRIFLACGAPKNDS